MKNKFLKKYPKLYQYTPKIGDRVYVIQVQTHNGEVISNPIIDDWGYGIGWTGVITDCGDNIIDVLFDNTQKNLCLLKTEVMPINF